VTFNRELDEEFKPDGMDDDDDDDDDDEEEDETVSKTLNRYWNTIKHSFYKSVTLQY